MIESIGSTLISVFFNLASTFIKIILAPVDTLISRFLPSVNTMIGYVSNFLDLAMSYVGWVLDAFGIPSVVLTFIVSCFILRYTIYFSIYLVKIIFGWLKK